MYIVQRINISSIFSRNSEASATEFPKNIKEMLLGTDNSSEFLTNDFMILTVRLERVNHLHVVNPLETWEFDGKFHIVIHYLHSIIKKHFLIILKHSLQNY